LTKGTASAVPKKPTTVIGFSRWVLFFLASYEPSKESVPQRLKPMRCQAFSGTAEAVPFVES
jgi:hypothetical protein